MKVGCVREIKNNEFRVGLTPDNVKAYVAAGHEVFIERGAGIGSGFPDADYEAAGAIMKSAENTEYAAPVKPELYQYLALLRLHSRGRFCGRTALRDIRRTLQTEAFTRSGKFIQESYQIYNVFLKETVFVQQDDHTAVFIR